MSKSKFKKQEVMVDCGGIQSELLLVHPIVDEEEETLTPADYDRWNGITCIKVVKPSPVNK